MKKITRLYLFLCLSSLIAFSSCVDDEGVTPEVTIPATYDFANVDYSGQTTRLAQLSEMKTYMATSQESGVALDADRLAAMYSNSAGANFSQEYDASKQLRDKTLEAVQADFDALIAELAEASNSTVTGEPGVSGVIESLDGEKSYLIGDDGLDHAQLVEKGLMAACFYFQATSVYMGDGRMNETDNDNETVEPGKGTEMEHHWDEAFGYLGAPIDFPVNTDGLFFWANYTNRRDAVLGNADALMTALKKGRAAISAKQYDVRDEAIAEARKEWELVTVATTLHYLNVGINQFEDKAIAFHGVSEAIAFLYAIKFNEAKTIDNSQVDEYLTMIAGSSDFAEMNLWEATAQNWTAVRDDLAADYGLNDRKEDF